MGPKSYRHMGPLELIVYIGGKDSRVVRLPTDGKVTLGRGAHNGVVLEDTSVSREHAILYLGPELRVVDKSSRNGTEVYKPGRYSGTDTTIAHHPERDRSFEVEVGDRIKLGSVIVVVRKAMFEPEKGTSGPRMWTQSPTIVDPLMEALFEDVRVAAESPRPVPILVYGETGAGKESIAREVHDASPRKSRPFVTVNCAQFTDNLVESALFGHMKGAFTGSFKDHKGFFETAHTGTLFLDEVAELSPEAQAKLLRVLDYGEVCPIGATEPRYVDVRVVAATNKNLHDCVMRGKFREDLFYRLRGFEFEVPPLRKRPKDIVPLAERFLGDFCMQDNQPPTFRFSEAALACLKNYSFPGNVRELKKAVEVAWVRCKGGPIRPEHFPSEISNISAGPPEPESTPNVALQPPDAPRRAPLPSPVPQPRHTPSSPNDEKDRLLKALIATGFNQKQAAILLGISNRTLVNWLNKYPDIPRPKKKIETHVDLPPAPPNPLLGKPMHDNWPYGEL